MFDIEREADAADVIISGYAIVRCDEGLRVLNLNNGKSAAVFMPDGTLIETNMDDIEAAIGHGEGDLPQRGLPFTAVGEGKGLNVDHGSVSLSRQAAPASMCDRVTPSSRRA